ncbi:SixA phosphatase family protein [Rhabdaerophilum sp.]|uniref:SixA phosphatase family protein n=1 Tax=Rhabdaerophilum sp. TaxID=2717341 RepID=UPI0038D50849
MPVRLILMRHAKSAWPDGVADFDRPLAPRGQEAAPLMGRWLGKQPWKPDLVLVSAARRTRETWAHVAPTLPGVDMEATQSIYAASAGSLLDLVRESGGAMVTLMLVGHNPGMQELAFGLADPAAGDREALRRLSRKYPTAGIAILEQDGGWKDVAPGSMRLSTFITPRALGGIDED